MPLLQVLVILIVIGVLLWLGNTYLPLDPKIRKIINVVVVCVVVLWLLGLFFGFGSLSHLHVGRVT